MDKVVLQSSRGLPDCSNYSVGVFQDGELHITPLKGIIQMRPQFNHLDKSGKGGKDETKNAGDGEKRLLRKGGNRFASKNVDNCIRYNKTLWTDGEEEEEAVKQVNVTFARQKSDYVTKMREQSFQEQTKKSLEEQWIPTRYMQADSSQAEVRWDSNKFYTHDRKKEDFF